MSDSIRLADCLNPFRSGRCLSTDEHMKAVDKFRSLNPFRSGRCLSTDLTSTTLTALGTVSIPFDQGDVFRHAIKGVVSLGSSSQSLSIRAMSFDK